MYKASRIPIRTNLKDNAIIMNANKYAIRASLFISSSILLYWFIPGTGRILSGPSIRF